MTNDSGNMVTEFQVFFGKIISDCLPKYLCVNIRSLIIYGAPAWLFILNDCDNKCLERIQRSATRTILLELSYKNRLSFLKLPTLYDFVFDSLKDILRK